MEVLCGRGCPPLHTYGGEPPQESLQFGRAFPRILQAVWEADPIQGPVRVSKLDVTDTYQYPPPIDSPTDALAATAKATAREILEAPSLLSFLASKQRKTLGGLPEGVKHPAAALLKMYVE